MDIVRFLSLFVMLIGVPDSIFTSLINFPTTTSTTTAISTPLYSSFSVASPADSYLLGLESLTPASALASESLCLTAESQSSASISPWPSLITTGSMTISSMTILSKCK